MKKKKKKKHSYSVCPGGTERVASVFVGNEGKGRKRKGGHPSHPTATHVGGGCVAEEHGGGMASRQSSLRAFQYMARAFEVAGFRRGRAGRKGTPTSTGGRGVGRETLLILLLISSRPIPRADVGGKRVKAKEGPKGWRGEGGKTTVPGRRNRRGWTLLIWMCRRARQKRRRILEIDVA